MPDVPGEFEAGDIVSGVDSEEAVIDDSSPPVSDEEFAEGARTGRSPNEKPTALRGRGGFRRVPDEDIWKYTRSASRSRHETDDH